MEKPPKTKEEREILDWSHGAPIGASRVFNGVKYTNREAGKILTPYEVTREALMILLTDQPI